MTTYENVLAVHVLPRWSRRPLIRIEHGVLSGILSLAVRDRRLPSNPATGVALPVLRQGRRKYLTAPQVEALADTAGPGRVAIADRLDVVRESARKVRARTFCGLFADQR